MHESVDVLQSLFIIFLLARLGGEIFTRLGQPSVVGELFVGMIAGQHALGLIHETEVLRVIAELGVIFLLFEVGLENRFSDLRKVGGTASAVAISGVVVPFAIGAGLLLTLGRDSSQAMFMGAAMVATSVGVTARVIAELGLLRERESRVILGAAVIDDVLGLLVLAVVAGAAAGSLTSGQLTLLIVEAALFLFLLATVGTRIARRHGSLFEKVRVSDGPFVVGVTICLGLSALAGQIGLAAIVGAFLAGMVLAETREQFMLEKRIEPITQFLTPYFFVLTGAAVDLRILVRAETAVLAVLVVGLAVVAKVVPCSVAALRMGRRSALIVGVGMVPRGEVGIIVADIGKRTGVVPDDLFGVVVAMSILTTLIAPPILRVLFADRLPVADDRPTGGEPFGAASVSEP